MSADQYAIRWPNLPVAYAHHGRRMAHGLVKIFRSKGIDAVVVVRNGWDGEWRDDTSPSSMPSAAAS